MKKSNSDNRVRQVASVILAIVLCLMPLTAFAESWDACPKTAPVCPLSKFPDVKVNAWYHDCVHFCLDMGIMSGDKRGVFLPYETTDRSMVYSILYRLDGSPEPWPGIGDSSDWIQLFDDVQTWRWYYPCITWAVNNDIALTPIARGEFDPNTSDSAKAAWNFGPLKTIAREEIAVVFYNYVKYKGYDVSAVKNDLADYKDCGSVSHWAWDAVLWCNSVGVLEGRANGNLDPLEEANRAEIASFFYKFIRVLNELESADKAE